MTNLAISSAAVQSWTVPQVAVARRKRYAATVQIDAGNVTIHKSIPAALHSLGVTKGVRTVRAAARDNAYVELSIDGKIVVISTIEIH